MAENSKLALFWSKTAKIAQNQCFFHIFFKVKHQIFLMKPWLYECKKMAVSLFCRKFKIGPFLTKNGQNLVIFGQKLHFFSEIDSKLFMLFFIWNIFSQILSQYFHLSCCPMWPNFGYFRGSCCVKITKNGSKSTFLEPYLVSCIHDIAERPQHCWLVLFF